MDILSVEKSNVFRFLVPEGGILCILLEPARTGLLLVICRIPWAYVWSKKCSGIPTLQALKSVHIVLPVYTCTDPVR